MKRWISALTLCGLLAFVAAPLIAPTPARAAKAAGVAGKKQKAGKLGKLKMALAKINLTAEQKPKVDAAVATAETEMKKLREGGGKPDKKQAKQVLTGLRTQLAGILTAEQQKQLEELLPKKKAKGKKPA